MTIREALAEANAALAAAGIETPSLDAGLLLAGVLNTNRSSLIAAGNEHLTAESLAAFNGFIQRRLAGECTAYILGRKEFYGLEFTVNPSVLIPRPDTETLVEAALSELKKMAANGQPLRVLDICTGSGAIAIALKHEMPQLEVWAADISAEALAVANANAVAIFDGAACCPPESVTFFQGDLYEAIPKGAVPNAALPSPSPFSVIVSNPPYIPTDHIAGLSPEVRMEPHIALDGGSDGLDLIRTIISRAPEYLCPGGSLLLEADPRQMHAIAALLHQSGFTEIYTCKDLSGNERVIGGKSTPSRS